MAEQIMELLDEAIKNRLEKAKQSDVESEDEKHAFKEAMIAIDKKIEYTKLETSHNEQLMKAEIEKEKNLREEEVKVKEAKKDRWVQIGTFVAGLIIAPIIGQIIDRSNMKTLCNFEKDYTFTTSFGRGLASKVSRFKK